MQTATAYRPPAGSANSALGAQEGVRDLDEDARAVAGLGVRALRAAMLQIVERPMAREIVSCAGCPSSRARQATPHESCSKAGS